MVSSHSGDPVKVVGAGQLRNEMDGVVVSTHIASMTHQLEDGATCAT
jgi:hypothetical protein